MGYPFYNYILTLNFKCNTFLSFQYLFYYIFYFRIVCRNRHTLFRINIIR